MVSFADDAVINIKLDEFLSEPQLLNDKIYELPFSGGKTNIARALQVTREEFFTDKNGHRSGKGQDTSRAH